MARKFNYVHLFKNCRLFLSADTCFCDQFEMMHRGKFEKSRTKLKTITSFISICFQSRASIFFVDQSRACKILDVYCYRQWLQWTKWKNNNTAAVYYAILWIYYYLRHWNNNSSQRCSHVSIQSDYIV